MRLIGLALLLVTSLTGVARADTESDSDPCSESRTTAAGIVPRRLILEDGESGMFYPVPLDRLVLCEVRELRLRRIEVRGIDAEINALERQVEFTERQVVLAVEARDRLEGVVEAAEGRARDLEERLDHWTRSQLLGAAVGVLVAAAIFYLTTLALDALRSD